jgi:mono/diheme cytochrome c family protein
MPMNMTQKATRSLFSGFIFLLLLSLITACGAPDGNPSDGKRWYMMHNCYSCHGIHGNDGRAVDIAQVDMGFSRFVRRLRRENAPIMPEFPSSKLSNQDAADIYAYLKSVKK